MKVSIITVCYNSEETIADAIESVLQQTYPDIEYLIIDGKSSDQTMEVVSRYADRISRIVSEKDEGVYFAMNKGIELASGNLIGILNSDDFYSHPKVIEQVVDAVKARGADAAYGDLQYIDRFDTTKVVRHWKTGKHGPSSFLWGWMPPHPTFFVKKSIYRQHGAFDTSFRKSADYELMLRLLHRHQIKATYVQDVLVKMRVGGVSNGSVRYRLEANQEDVRAWSHNGLKPYVFTGYMKPLRKLTQFRLIPYISSKFSST